MIFDYRNARTGDIRQVSAERAADLPAWVSFNPDGTAQAAHANDPLAYERIISMPSGVHTGRRNAGCNHRTERLPVSLALPRTTEKGEVVNRWGQSVRKLANGAYADMSGRRIVADANDAARHCGETGYERVTD